MIPSLPHKETTRFAALALCLVCVTATTPTFEGAASPERVRPAALRGEPAGEADLRSAAQLEVLSQPDPVTRSRLNDALARIPMCFEANQGQAASNAQFVSAGSGQRLLLSPSAATLELRQSSSDEDKPLTMNLVSADPAAEIRGLDLLPTRANYFIGNDRSTWHANIPTFGRVICEKVYPGVDMIYHGTQRQLEYDFVVGPGADPDRIRLRFEGAQKTSVDSFGNLIIQAKDTEIRHNKPVAYQQSEGVRREVAVAFSLFHDGTAGFEIGDYDRTRELVIDPVLVFSTYLGGSGPDTGRGIFVDSAGRAYVLGDSRSSDFTHGTADNTDIFVGAFTANGGTFSYTFFGGSKNDFATGLAVDADGNAYISGSTQSENLGGPNSINPALSGPSDAFVAKLNPIDGTFAYSTLIGGTGDETGVSIAIDSDGNAYISGKTTSTDFPTANAIQSSYGGGDSDAFVSKISPDGSSLVYSTYLGGSGSENRFERTGIAVDSARDAYVTGDTGSGDFPSKDPIRPLKTGDASSIDAYVSKINPQGSAFVYSTLLGGALDDAGLGIATDSAGNAYVTGETLSTAFTGSSSTRPSSTKTDAFVAKLNPTGSAFSYLTFIGGVNSAEVGNAITVDASNNAYVTGTASPGFSTMNSVQSYSTGLLDVLAARLSAAGTINFSTYLGGDADDAGLGIAVDSTGNMYVTGVTNSPDLLTSDALREQNAGETDALVFKIDPNANPNGPLIYDVRLNGKQMVVLGQNFSVGAFVRLNDSPKETNGGVDPSQVLTSKKAGKKAKPGRPVQIQVENADGKRSNLFFFVKPV